MKKLRHMGFRSHFYNVTVEREFPQGFSDDSSCAEPLPNIDYFVLLGEIRLLSPVLYKSS